MAFVSSSGFGRRLSTRRRGVDWRIVAMTAASGVVFVAMLARPF